MADQEDTRRIVDELPKALVPRIQLGGTDRKRGGPEFENRPPVSSQELSRGPAELIEERQPKVNWRVFIIASVIIIAFSVWAMLVPTSAQSTMKTLVAW